MGSSVCVEARDKTLVVTLVKIRDGRVYLKGKSYRADSGSERELIRPGERRVFEVDDNNSVVVREITPEDFFSEVK